MNKTDKLVQKLEALWHKDPFSEFLQSFISTRRPFFDIKSEVSELYQNTDKIRARSATSISDWSSYISGSNLGARHKGWDLLIALDRLGTSEPYRIASEIAGNDLMDQRIRGDSQRLLPDLLEMKKMGDKAYSVKSLLEKIEPAFGNISVISEIKEMPDMLKEKSFNLPSLTNEEILLRIPTSFNDAAKIIDNNLEHVHPDFKERMQNISNNLRNLSRIYRESGVIEAINEINGKEKF